MNAYLSGVVQLLLVWGLVAVVFLGIGIWALRQESSGVVRGAGHLLIAANVVLWTATLTTMLVGLGVTESIAVTAG